MNPKAGKRFGLECVAREKGGHLAAIQGRSSSSREAVVMGKSLGGGEPPPKVALVRKWCKDYEAIAMVIGVARGAGHLTNRLCEPPYRTGNTFHFGYSAIEWHDTRKLPNNLAKRSVLR